MVVLAKTSSSFQVFLEASQHASCFVWFQHPLTADDLGVGFALIHLSVDSLVSGAVEFCGFGDCLRLKWNFFQQAMQRLVCCVQCSVEFQLGVCERLNGIDFLISVHSRVLHKAVTRLTIPDFTN